MFTLIPLSGMVDKVCFHKIWSGRKEFMNSALPEFITFLQDPAVYPHPVDEIRLVQTHISYVLIAGDRVYKFKKPVNFGFLDFTNLEKRKFFCEQELILNRRLCPDIYLDLVTVTRSDAVLALNGDGEVVEFGVRMKRMPEEGMMGKFIASGKLSQRHIDLIVDTLIPFYERAAGNEEIGAFGRAEAVAVNVLENFDQTEGFIGCEALNRQQYEKISGYAGKFLKNKTLFEKRIAGKRIRDCHGDLYSANICFDGDRVHIFDCIEFNKRFRYADVASDIAFLAMDLDFQDLQELSRYFIARFEEKSGDAELDAMLNFYKCYRAYVRGKIGLFTAHDRKVDMATKDNSLRMAKRYFSLAERYAGA